MEYRNLIAAGALAGLCLALLRTPRGARLRACDTLGIAALAAVLAGRAGFVLLNGEYFAAQPAHILALGAAPGYSEHAALAGAWAVGAWRRSTTTVIIVALAAGAGAALGCIEAGCAYGRELFPGDAWFALAADWPDAYALRNPRWPTQALQAGWLVPWTAVGGWIGASGLIIAFAGGDFALQFLRADSAPMLLGLRAPQWLDLALLVIALAERAARLIKRAPRP